MAQCKECKKSVGCGCQLVNGLCINCVNKKAQSKSQQPSIKITNTTSTQ